MKARKETSLISCLFKLYSKLLDISVKVNCESLLDKHTQHKNKI